MVKKINALKARKNLGQLLEEVYYKDNQYVIERAGRPMAAVVPVWQLEGWRKRRERLCGLQVPTGRADDPLCLHTELLPKGHNTCRHGDDCLGPGAVPDNF